jgi:hypothetical protein
MQISLTTYKATFLTIFYFYNVSLQFLMKDDRDFYIGAYIDFLPDCKKLSKINSSLRKMYDKNGVGCKHYKTTIEMFRN